MPTEQTPVSNQEEPSAKYYHRAEQAILGGGAGCVLRFPDMYGAPGDLTFPIMQAHCGAGIVVTEQECLTTMGLAFERLKVVLEPGGAVSLAAALFLSDEIKGDAVIAVTTGGNVDPAVFLRALETL